jgi:O-antigen/teichoic acid export membrane protein
MDSIEELKRKSIAGVVSYGVRTGFLYLVAVIATLILGVYLDPAEFGIYYVVLSVIGIFTFLSDVGLAAALVQSKKEPTVDDLRTAFTVQQVLAFTIFFLTLGLTPIWKNFTNLNREGLELLYVLAFSFVLSSFKTIPSILLERKLHFNKLVIPQIIEQLLFYGIAVTMAVMGYGVKSFTVAVLVRSIAGVISIYFLQSWQVGLMISKQSMQKLLGFGLKFQANDLLARLKDDLFIVVLAKFLSPTEMGYLGWSKRWSMFPYQFSVSNVIAITFPTYSRLQDKKDLLAKALEKSLFFIALLIFPVLAGMSLLAQPLIEILPEYQKWQPALPLLYFFCLNIAFAAIANPMISTLNAIGNIDKTLKLMIFMTIATWVLSPLAYREWGVVGIAIVSAVVAAASLTSYFWIKKTFTFSFAEQLWRQLLATMIMGVTLIILRNQINPSWRGLLFEIVVGGASYFVILVLFGKDKIMNEIKSLRVK